MSATLMGAVLGCGPKKGSMRYALVAIADNSDDYGFACPSIDTIAQKACCDARTAMRLVQALEREGWMKVERRVLFGKGSVYFIDIAKLGVTVNPKMRRSPLHVEIAKLLASRAAAPKEIQPPAPPAPPPPPPPPPPAAPASGDNLSPEKPCGEIAAPENSGDNPQGAQVTKEAESGDKTPFPILKNRCEPLLNPDNNPLPPSSPKGECNFPNCDCLPEAECPDKPGAPPPWERSGCAAVQRVKRECDWIDRRLDSVIELALRAHCRKFGATDLLVSAGVMVAGWREYLKRKHLLRFQVGERKFITRGWWLNDTAWPWDEKLLELQRRL